MNQEVRRGAEMRRATVWAGVVAVWLLAGCAGVDIETDYDPGYPFQALRTFAWMPLADRGAVDPRIHNDLFDARVRRAVQAALERKGYTRVADDAAADFRVGYRGQREDRVSVKIVNEDHGYRGVWSERYWHDPGMPQTYVYEFTRSTLWLDLVDGAEGRLIWRGSAQTEVQRQGRAEEREARLTRVVDQLLAGFPPR
jgi:hypothetical protein